jgi:hypothetical protein
MVKNGWNTDGMTWMAKKFRWVVHMYEFNDTQFRYFFNDILKNVRAFLPSPSFSLPSPDSGIFNQLPSYEGEWQQICHP